MGSAPTEKPVFSNVPPRIETSACPSAKPRACTSTCGSNRSTETGAAKVPVGSCNATRVENTVIESSSTVSAAASAPDVGSATATQREGQTRAARSTGLQRWGWDMVPRAKPPTRSGGKRLVNSKPKSLNQDPVR